MQRDVHHVENEFPDIDMTGIDLEEAARRVLLLLSFFQAEDGIRDIGGTGVQTCALPISALARNGPRHGFANQGKITRAFPAAGMLDRKSVRVGKECRSRWSPYH